MNEEDYKHPLLFVQLPHFVADLESDETKQLREKYLQQRRKICEIYRDGDFLEITLRRLTS
jgi:hypothetical protein